MGCLQVSLSCLVFFFPTLKKSLSDEKSEKQWKPQYSLVEASLFLFFPPTPSSLGDEKPREKQGSPPPAAAFIFISASKKTDYI